MAYDRLDVPLLSVCVKLSTWNRALPSPGHGVSRVIAVSCLFDLICISRGTITHRGTKTSSWWSPTPRSPELHRRCFAWALSMQVCKMQTDPSKNSFLNLLTIRHRNELAGILYFFHVFSYLFHIR